MYNGWTNWETWITVTWAVYDGVFSADELRQEVEALFSAIPQVGLARDLIDGAVKEINFEEIAKTFEDEEA